MTPPQREALVPLETYQAACSGDPAALKQFFTAALPYIRGVVHGTLSRCRPGALSRRDDYVQDVCVALLAPSKDKPSVERAAMKRYNPARGPIHAFLFVFSRTRVLDRLKHDDAGGRHTALIPPTELADWAAQAEQQHEKPDWRLPLERLDQHLQSALSPRERQVLELHLAGMLPKQIAAQLEITESNVYAITYRLRHAIAGCWLQVMGESFPMTDDKKPPNEAQNRTSSR